MICDDSVLTAMPTPSQSSDEDVRLSVDIPSTLDKVSVCVCSHNRDECAGDVIITN